MTIRLKGCNISLKKGEPGELPLQGHLLPYCWFTQACQPVHPRQQGIAHRTHQSSAAEVGQGLGAELEPRLLALLPVDLHRHALAGIRSLISRTTNGRLAAQYEDFQQGSRTDIPFRNLLHHRTHPTIRLKQGPMTYGIHRPALHPGIAGRGLNFVKGVDRQQRRDEDEFLSTQARTSTGSQRQSRF